MALLTILKIAILCYTSIKIPKEVILAMCCRYGDALFRLPFKEGLASSHGSVGIWDPQLLQCLPQLQREQPYLNSFPSQGSPASGDLEK